MQVHDAAVRVGEDLYLDVARPLEIALDVDGRVGERGLRAARGRRECRRQIGRPVDAGHADAAPAAGGLEHERKPDLRRHRDGLGGVGDRAGAARHRRHAGRRHEAPGLGLVAHRPHGLGRGSDEREPCPRARLGESPALREETVAGVHRVGAAATGGVEQPLDVEIALARRRGPEQDRPVGVAHVERVLVGLGVHGDSAEPEPPAGAEDAPRDLATVGHEHGIQSRPQGWAEASSTTTTRQPPGLGAQRSCSTWRPRGPPSQSFTTR